MPQPYEPVVGSSYPLLLRHEGHSVARSVGGVILSLALYYVVAGFIGQVVVGLGWLLSGRPGAYAAYSKQATTFQLPTGLLAANLGITGLIVVAAFVTVLVHRSRPRWLTSVDGRLRWRFLVYSGLIALVVFGAVVVLGLFGGAGSSFRPQPYAAGFLVVILLTSPLQAAGEEFLFRGYILQSLGSIFRSPWYGAVLSALVFAALHGSSDPSLLVNRFAFGLLAAALVLKTGGLEAGIAAHIVNNLLAFGVAAFTSSVASAYGVRTLSWMETGIQVAAYGFFALCAYLLSRRLRLRTTVTAAE